MGYFNTTLVFIYRNRVYNSLRNGRFQYNTCFYLSNVFPPFFVFIIIAFPHKINVFSIFPNRHKFFSYLFQNSFPPLFYAAFRHSSAFRDWEKSSSLRDLPTLCTKCDFPTCLEIFPFHSKILSDNKKGAMQNSAQLQSLSMTSARYSRWHRSAFSNPLLETLLHFPPSARPAGKSA